MTTDQPAYSFEGDWSGQLVATSIHTGHDLRPEVAQEMILDEDVRFREEDPFTDRITAGMPARIVVHRSRFETDLNRDREGSVYRTPDDCWGLQVWRTDPLAEEIVERSRAQHDAFYADVARRLDELAARGPFVLYDVHSYNHRRDGADADPEPQQDNPDVNVGTGSLDRERFGPVVDAFMGSLAGSYEEANGRSLDVRENVKFKGANLSRWVHQRYPGVGCALALEFKKTYMDEWTGAPDEAQIARCRAALDATVEPVLAALEGLS